MARTTRQDSSLVPGWVEPMLAKPDGGLLREGPEWGVRVQTRRLPSLHADRP
jgi:hypothetical protein